MMWGIEPWVPTGRYRVVCTLSLYLIMLYLYILGGFLMSYPIDYGPPLLTPSGILVPPIFIDL